MAAILAYDAIHSMNDGHSWFSIIFGFMAALYFAFRMVVTAIEMVKKEELAWKHIVSVGFAIALEVFAIMTFVLCYSKDPKHAWTVLGISSLISGVLLSEALLYRQRSLAEKSKK